MTPSGTGPRAGRLRLYRIIAAVLLPALLFAMAEVGLRLAGFGHPTSFALRRQVTGQPRLVNNPFFTWPVFGPRRARESTPFALEVPKGVRTYRIFVMGGSAAQGDPDPSFSLARLLEALLADRYPGVRFEVVNAGITAVNSHVVYQIARSCRRLEPDLLVLYLGNNEVIGPYGAASTQGPLASKLSLIRLGAAVRSTRLGQLMGRIIAGIGGDPSGQHGEWGGMETFAETELRETDPRLENTYSHFERNLVDIRDLAYAARIPIILCTVPVNLRDWAPFGSLNRQALSEGDFKRWSGLIKRGAELQDAGEYAGAAEALRQASAIDDTQAELQFRLARCKLAMGDVEAADSYFRRARDLDTGRFRADSRINQIIRTIAGGVDDPGVRLVDLERVIAAHSLAGIPGDDLLYDHVHLSFAGTYVAARAVLDALERMAPDRFAAATAGRPPLTIEACAERLVFSGWHQYRLAEDLRSRVERPPFTSQSDHGDRLEALTRAAAELSVFAHTDGARSVAARLQGAVDRRPEDWILRYNLGLVQLHDLDDAAAAVEHFDLVAERLPTFFFAHLFLGEALLLQRRSAEAVASFRTALEFHPQSVEVLTKLAIALRREDEFEQAYRLLKRALAIEVDSDVVHYYLGDTLLLLDADNPDARDRAAEHFRRALQINPEHGRARQALERTQIR